MDKEHRKSSLDVVSHRIAETFKSLELFRVPAMLALHSVIGEAEARLEHARLTHSDANAQNIAWIQKLGLSRLIPEIIRVCPPSDARKAVAILVSESRLSTLTSEAIEFATRYEFAQYYLTLARMGYYDVIQDGRFFTFNYVNPIESKYINFGGHLQAKGKLEAFPHEYIAHVFDRINRKVSLISPALGIANRSRAINTLSGQIYQDCFEIEHEVLKPSDLPPDISLGAYSLEDARRMWVSLRALCTSILIAAKVLRDTTRPVSANDFPPFMFQRSGLIDVIVKGSGTSENVADEFLTTITLDVRDSRPDLQLTPIIPSLDSDTFTLSPLVLGSVDWETCTLRRLSVTKSNYYTGTVVPQKEKPLAEQVAALFRQKGFESIRTVKIRDSHRITKGEIDVAVYDEDKNHLSLIELKWFIPDDSAMEACRNDREIEEGHARFMKFLEYLLPNLPKHWKRLFPKINPNLTSMTIDSYMVSKGGVGRTPLERQIPIFDYDLFVTQLKSTEGTLTDIWHQVLKRHQELIELGHPMATLRLAGVGIRIPGTMQEATDADSKYELDRQVRRCSCGSGRVQRDCCSGLD